MKKYNNIENLASVLRLARSMAGLTQAQLAKKLKTKQSAISRMENGNITSIRFAEKVAEACGFALRFNHITIEDGSRAYSSFTSTKNIPSDGSLSTGGVIGRI